MYKLDMLTLTKNLDAYTLADLEDLNVMTIDELNEYEYHLDNDTGELSPFDHVRAYYTLKQNLKTLGGI